MSARGSRRAATFDFSSLTAIECLLVAQAAHEFGTAPSSWTTISKLMYKHALVSRPKNFFTPTTCSSIYDHLMREAGLDRTEAANSPKAPENLALAQKHFQIRFDELVGLIQAEETKFKSVMKEMEEIKSGQWDPSLKARLAGAAVPPSRQAEAESSLLSDRVAREQPDGHDMDLAAKDDIGNDADSSATKDATTEDAEVAELEEEQGEGDHSEQGEGENIGAPAETHEEEITPAIGHHDATDDDPGTEEVEDLLEVDSNADEESAPVELAYPNEPPRSSEPPASSKNVEMQDEQGESSADEPLQTIRRSTRRKSSAASTAPPASSSRARTRRQRQIQEQESVASDTETDAAPKDETPQIDEDFPSSPYESSSAKTREGKRKASFPDETARDTKRAREDSEFPEDDESSLISHSTRSRPNRQGVRGGEQVPNKKFQNVIGLLHQQISTHKNGTIFHNPIKLSDAPDYHDIVKRPMDLKTMKARVKDGAISNSLEFQRDAYLMFANAMMYNRPGSDVYTMAEEMMLDSEMQIMNFKQTEGFRAQR